MDVNVGLSNIGFKLVISEVGAPIKEADVVSADIDAITNLGWTSASIDCTPVNGNGYVKKRKTTTEGKAFNVTFYRNETIDTKLDTMAGLEGNDDASYKVFTFIFPKTSTLKVKDFSVVGFVSDNGYGDITKTSAQLRTIAITPIGKPEPFTDFAPAD